jgi:hypothetical protein
MLFADMSWCERSGETSLRVRCERSGFSHIRIKGIMVFNATFHNISVILWLLVLLVEETRVPRENHRHAQ